MSLVAFFILRAPGGAALPGKPEDLSVQPAAHAPRLLDLRPGERVLDVAAGTGAFGLLAARAGAEVLAANFAPGMVDRLRERIAGAQLSGISAKVMDGQDLALPDGSFDASALVLGLGKA